MQAARKQHTVLKGELLALIYMGAIAFSAKKTGCRICGCDRGDALFDCNPEDVQSTYATSAGSGNTTVRDESLELQVSDIGIDGNNRTHVVLLGLQPTRGKRMAETISL